MKSSQPKPPTDDTPGEPGLPSDAEVNTLVALAPPIPIMAPADALAAGVEAARRIEESADRIRRARAHAKRARKSEARRSTRRQLRRLLRTLHARQQAVLSQGILPEDHHTLAAHLHAIDRALEEFLLSRRPKKGGLKQVRKAAKTLRQAL
jgi:hypothetical protein